MKFLVGYQIRKDESFIDTIIHYHQHISEIYFSWEDIPNGRNSSFQSAELTKYDLQNFQFRDFERMKNAGLRFNLLLNGNCYGKYALSRSFFTRIGDSIDFLSNKYALVGVTTTSPVIAKFVKQNFPDLHVRASVNMEIGTTEGMEYIAEWFDGYYARRECNRDIAQLQKLKAWCDSNGKQLYGLANSGCLNNCSFHVFHDNLVAHEKEIAEMDNAYQFEAQCQRFLRDEKNKKNWLQRTNFIRPEDIPLYESIFDGCKLATRINYNPSAIVRAYINGSYSGNIPALLEPDHSSMFYPSVIENKKMPFDFAQQTMTCKKNCDSCSYCVEAIEEATVML